MRQTAVFLIIVLLFTHCHSTRAVRKFNVTGSLPSLRAINGKDTLNLKIAGLHISIDAAAGLSQTTFDISFFNPTDRVLEGAFEFPLQQDQQVWRYALEIDGELREGVAVEKEKARIAFENTVRKQIDPGLIEKTAGNNYKTRVYPIPARGYKRIVIGIEQVLTDDADGLRYFLPLAATDTINEFSLSAVVEGDRPDLNGNEIDGFAFTSDDGKWAGILKKRNVAVKGLFTFSIPARDKTAVTETIDDQSYFYARASVPGVQQKRTMPSRIGILWDRSASLQARDTAREKKFLLAYLQSLGNVSVQLIPFNIKPQQVQLFQVDRGDATALFAALAQLDAEGGTQLGSLNLARYDVDEFILFSDGLSTFGSKQIAMASKPVHTIASSAGFNTSYLQTVSQKTNGRFIDLTRLQLSAAIDLLHFSAIKILRSTTMAGKIRDSRVTVSAKSLELSGMLLSDKAVVECLVSDGSDEDKTMRIEIEKTASQTGGLISRKWAARKIEELEADYEANKKQITELGKKYSIVTRNTSLIVLDRIEDYVTYRIVPPPSLRTTYFKMIAELDENNANAKAAGLNEAVSAMEQLKEWYAKVPVPRPSNRLTPPINTGEQELTSADSGSYRALPMQLTANATALNYNWTPNASHFEAEAADAMNGSDLQGTILNIQDRKKEDFKVDESVRKIEVSGWNSNADYLKKIKHVQAGERWLMYLKLKKKHQHQPSFYSDMAKYFEEHGAHDDALLILSNIAELKLEDPELQRILAYQLLEMNETALAVFAFREVKDMREEEPQSYRDLALALDEAGLYNEAISTLYQLITGNWDSRFGDVKSIALNEMNAIISREGAKANVAEIDPRLIYAMPVDIRIVIGWSANNSDIDLWVTDPEGEKCFYQNPETPSGGKISADVTQGYGPEEFKMKKALNGKYEMQANLFGDHRQTLGGPVTIRAELFTDFGRPDQKRKTINFRVEGAKDIVNIGALAFGK